jgi:23S rRNA pseudouridine1911/1915/1917 synthase
MQSENQISKGFEYGVRHILSPKSGPLADAILSTLGISAEEFAEVLQLGGVYLEGERITSAVEIEEGAYVCVHTKPRRFPANTFNWRERIFFEDENFLVVNKPAGLPVHPSVDNLRENLQVYLADFLGTEIYVTHRLDVPTSGLLVMAKSKNFLPMFNHLLATRSVQKIYRARVQGLILQPGLVTHYMEPSPRAPKTLQLDPRSEWQECQLRILEVQNFSTENEQEVLIELLTGRTHQIRAQLAALGAPICGDVLYGARKKYDLEQIDLEAESLKFLEFEFTTKR